MAIEQASLISALYLVHRVSLKLYNCYANRLVRFAVSAVGGLLILGEQVGATAVVGIVVVSIGAVLGALPPGKLKLVLWFKAR